MKNCRPQNLNFYALCTEMNVAFSKFYNERKAITDPDEKAKFEQGNDPGPAHQNVVE